MLARQVTLPLDPVPQPFFPVGFFQDRDSQLFAQGWL
jgi:hypothetical protein